MSDDELWRPWLSFLFYGGCFFMMLISYALTTYVRRYPRHALMNKLQDTFDSNPGYIKQLEYLVSAWRDRWFLTMGVDLILQNRTIDIGALDQFDMGALPARFRYLAMFNAICISGALVWMIVAASWTILEGII